MEDLKQDIFNFALKIFLLLSPIFFFRTYVLSTAQGFFFIFGTFALFGISLFLRPKRQFFNPWIALFLLWALLRVFVGNSFSNIEQEWFNFWLDSAGFIYVFCGILLFYIVYCHAKNLEKYFKPILIVCIMNFILVIAQIIGHDFMWAHRPSLCGFMGISSQLGQYSAMSIPILIYINPFLSIIPFITLWLSRSVSPILAMFLGLTAYGVALIIKQREYRKIRIVCVILLIIWGMAFGIKYRGYIAQKWKCRPIMWKNTLRAITQRPYLGWGYRTFTDTVVKKGAIAGLGAREFNRPHQDWLHTVCELGLPILLFIGGFFIGLWRKFKMKQNKDKLTYLLATSVLISLIIGMGQTQIRYASIAGTFIVLLAFLNIKLDDHQK